MFGLITTRAHEAVLAQLDDANRDRRYWRRRAGEHWAEVLRLTAMQQRRDARGRFVKGEGR